MIHCEGNECSGSMFNETERGPVMWRGDDEVVADAISSSYHIHNVTIL